MRQQKFKRGKEKMLSIAQESGDGQTLVQPEDEDDDDDGMREIGRGQAPRRPCMIGGAGGARKWF